MDRYRRWLEMEVEPAVKFDYNRVAVEQTLHNDSQSEPRVIAGQLALQIMEAVGIPTARASLATDAEAAVRLAGEIGYPVVMKIESPDIVHKTEFGGVMVGLDSTEAVRAAYETMVANVQKRGVNRIDGVMLQKMATGREVILGLKRDPQYGHAVLFGLGGIYAEVMKDISLRVVPITRYDAYGMIREIRSYSLLAGARGAEPADINALTESLLRLSQLAGDFPQIRELDINPLLVAEVGKGVIAVDCRLVI
jgi:acetyltransferase